MKRTQISETKDSLGKTVKVCGWVNVVRAHGKILFVDLRDNSGILQLVFTPKDETLYKLAQTLRPEWVMAVEGIIKERPAAMVNPKIDTGKIELEVKKLEVLNESLTPPFEITADSKEVKEEVRLKYRYLDLRTERMKKNLLIRYQTIKHIRDFMDKKGFVEVETPLLTKSTPEGARDFLVPSRLHLGKFYALPQSPQQYKQLLITGGVERYFQIARCLRDEDPRADRQTEHTQLDFEMAFVDKKEEIMEILEELIIELVEKFKPLTGKTLFKKPLPKLTYKEAQAKYGTDKPDLRENKNSDELAFCWIIDFPLVEWDEDGGRWDAMHHPFTMPFEEDLPYLESDPGRVRSQAYDLVCNGRELGSGSIRIHHRDIQNKVFNLLAISEAE